MSTAAPCSLHPMETQPCAICTTGIRAAPAPDFAPPADPIDDLCGELNYIGMFVDDRGDGISPMCKRAAAALQRLRAENAELRAEIGAARDAIKLCATHTGELERAEAERDALAAIVRALCVWDATIFPTDVAKAGHLANIVNAARAKWEDKP